MNRHTTLEKVMSFDGSARRERSDATAYISMKGFVPSHKVIQYLLELKRRRWVLPVADKAARA